MKKLFLIPFTLIAGLICNAQMLAPTVIASSGGFSSNANGSLSYTVGEMTMVKTFSGNGNILTQGFQQPTEQRAETGLTNLAQDNFGAFTVYPNPAIDNLSYGFQLSEAGKVQITLYNAIGQKMSDVYHTNYENGKVIKQLNASEYAPRVYLLTMNFVSDKDGKTRTSSQKFQLIN